MKEKEDLSIPLTEETGCDNVFWVFSILLARKLFGGGAGSASSYYPCLHGLP
jgi:hypothetical protein